MGTTYGERRFAGRNIKYAVWNPKQPVMQCVDPLVGVDSETELIQNGYEWPPVVVAGFCSRTEDGDFCQLVMWQDLPAYIPKFLAINPTVKLVFFNLAFDVNVMGRDVFIEEMKKDGRFMELAINYKIHCIGTSGWVPIKTTLYDVVKTTLKVELNKEDGTRTSFRRGEAMNTQQLEYLVEDCAGTWLCGHAYNNMPTESDQARGSFVLSELSKNGVRVDVELLNKLRSIIISRMAPLAEELRAFGFRIKQDVDKLSDIERLKRLGELVGIVGLDTMLQHKKTIPKHWWWILAAFLHKTVYTTTPLLSDIREIYRAVLDRIATDPDTKTLEGKKLDKEAKTIAASAKGYLTPFLERIDCLECLEGKSAKPAIVLSELLTDLCLEGKAIEYKQDFEHKFFQEHEYWLGWLTVDGRKPLTPAKFIQKHLRMLMEHNPSLEFDLTETSKDNIRDYLESCSKKGELVDPGHLDALKCFKCVRADMWKLEDAGVADVFLDKYTEYKHLEKLFTTYLTPKYIEGDGKVHPSYNDMLVTGRTSASSPNVQNYPRESGLREQYSPPPGYVWMSCDYGQEEIVTLAATLKHRYGKSRLADAVNAGIDVHCFFSMYSKHQLDDMDLSEFTPEVVQEIKRRYAPYKDEEHPEYKKLKKLRSLAKVFNFGCGGGMQGPTMYINCRRQGFDITPEEAQALCDAWADTWPEVKAYFRPQKDVIVDASVFKGKVRDEDDEDTDEQEEELQEKVQTFRAVNNLGMWRVRGTRNSILNFPFQSLAAVVSKRALWLTFVALREQYPEAKLCIFIHDELIVECPEAIAADVAALVEKCMLQAAEDIMPGMFIKAEPALMRRWSKEAEPLFDEHGKLVPVENGDYDLEKFLK